MFLFSFGKSFWKTKTIEDQRKKQVYALENLKPKEETRPIEDNSNNKSKVTIIFNDIINKRKALMKELYDSIDYNNLTFEYVGPTKDVSFYGHKDSKEIVNAIKNNQIKFSDVKSKQKKFLSELSNIKMGKKNYQTKRNNNVEKFYLSREEVITFLETILKCYLILIMIQKIVKLREKGLKY